MACGCPTVATRVGGFKNTISDGENGVLVESDNAKELAEAIKRLLSDRKFRDKVSSNAVNHVKTNFDLNIITDKTLKAYKISIASFNKNGINNA